MTVRNARRLLHPAIVVSTALGVTIWFAVARGQDDNWDQLNYHIGIPFLLAHGRFWDSIDPAGIQSYFNPYVLQAQFFAMRHLGGMEFAIGLAVAQSLAFMVAGLICATIARPAGRNWGLALGLLGFALCLMAPVALSEAGTTFIDLVTAVPVLAAYALLLTRGRWLGPTLSGALAGALLGVAAALKLTNGIFALGAAGFALAGPDTWRQRLRWLLACGTAMVLAFAVVGGRWHLELWERFGNPFFPFYNEIFRSPSFVAATFHDTRFLPHSVLDIWRYPLYWFFGGSPTPGVGSPSSEVAFRDVRWVVAVPGGTVLVLALATFRRWGRRRLTEPATGLFFAFAVGYLVWLAEFGVHRYMPPLDILCGAVILTFAMMIPPRSLGLGLMVAVTCLSLGVMDVPDWGHLPWLPYWQSINPKPLDLGGPSIIFLTEKPSSFIAASLGGDARYVGLYEDFGLRNGANTYFARQLEQELSSMPGVQLKEVDRGAIPAVSAAILASYGLIATNRCKALTIAGEKFRICEVSGSR